MWVWISSKANDSVGGSCHASRPADVSLILDVSQLFLRHLFLQWTWCCRELSTSLLRFYGGEPNNVDHTIYSFNLNDSNSSLCVKIITKLCTKLSFKWCTQYFNIRGSVNRSLYIKPWIRLIITLRGWWFGESAVLATKLR